MDIEIPKDVAEKTNGASFYPEACAYAKVKREVLAGDGRFAPLALGVREFAVSGMKIMQI